MRVYRFLLLLLPLFGCAPDNNQITINRAVTLLDTNPDSSLVLMNSLKPSLLKTNRDRARRALYLSAALDKNYIDVCSDSIISIATEYYSRKGSDKEKMLTWYYNGIVLKNMRAFSSSVVSLEKAVQYAQALNDHHQMGLIYRNIAVAFGQMNNFTAAIVYMQKAVDCFEKNPSDSLYLGYARYSLATAYRINKQYDDSYAILNGMKNTRNSNLKALLYALEADMDIKAYGDYKSGISLYKQVPFGLLSFQDRSSISLAYSHLNKPDSANLWLAHAYSIAKDEADSATIGFTEARILLNRGLVDKAYTHLHHSTMVQDSLARALLSESISSAQRDYFMEEAIKKSQELKKTKEIGLLVGIIIILIATIIISALTFWSWKKDQRLKDLMAQIVINNQSIIQLSKDNASLLSTHYSERIRRLDTISRDYYLADSKTKKDIVFKQFKEYIGSIDNDSFYSSLEKDLNHYCNGIMAKFRVQVPDISGKNLRIISLFFAGLSYETVAILTRAQSVNSLKTKRSRFRKDIEGSNAKDKNLFLEMLDMKRQQTRKTKSDDANQ